MIAVIIGKNLRDHMVLVPQCQLVIVEVEFLDDPGVERSLDALQRRQVLEMVVVVLRVRFVLDYAVSRRTLPESRVTLHDISHFRIYQVCIFYFDFMV